MSPIAQTPSTLVAMVSSTSIVPPSPQRQPSRTSIDQVAVGLSSGRHQQLVDDERRVTARDLDPVVGPTHPRRGRTEMQLDALAEHLGEALGDLLIETTEQRRRSSEQHDLGPERREDVAHLGGDEPAADDAESLRQLGQPHDRVGRVEAETSRPSIAGTVGREPAAINTCGAVIVRVAPPRRTSTSNVLSATKRAVPSIRVTFGVPVAR